MGRLFGTDGARGVAVTELTCERAMEIGRAAAYVLTKESGKAHPNILVGMDTRISSKILEAALSAGLASVGANALQLGVVPTPAVAYLVKAYNADAGVMISASHNTVEYNGIKLFSSEGFKLPDSVEEEIESLILDRTVEIPLRNGTDVGRITRLSNGTNDYIQHIRDCAGAGHYAGDSRRFCFDCANGSSAATARKLFAYLGEGCEFIADEPDGTNINDNCGSTHIDQLCEYVKNGGMAAGFAFDGDADRCLAVDENGNVIDGDRIIAVLAKYMKQKGVLRGNAAVVTVMSNLGFHDFMRDNGMNTVCAKVGDRYVLEEMLKNGYNIGGEQSGHIILLDHATTGDGQLTAAMLIKVMQETGKTLSQLCEDIVDYPQLLVNVRITESGKGRWNTVPAITDSIAAAEKELSGSGRVLVRESGTEPLVRVMIEGKNMDMVKRLAESIAEEVRRSLT
ncbi:MAG: phosphoglucosamine mutase [Oscillospiraceae bacterium]|nr:phosphoglucosamine mutase [Oscillospiraceae bacterium]